VTHDLRAERRRVRFFFAGLLVASAILDLVGALLIHHQTRAQVLENLVPEDITLGGRTGVVMSIAWQFTCIVLLASIGFDLIKDLDIEDAALSAWILLGLWWFRPHFQADSEPRRLRWGLAALGSGIALAIVYTFFRTAVLSSQLSPEPGMVRTLETLAEALAGNPARYHALTERASWFLGTLPVVSYTLVLFALLMLLRPVLAPRAAAADTERVHNLLKTWGRNHISHLAVHGAPRPSPA